MKKMGNKNSKTVIKNEIPEDGFYKDYKYVFPHKNGVCLKWMSKNYECLYTGWIINGMRQGYGVSYYNNGMKSIAYHDKDIIVGKHIWDIEHATEYATHENGLYSCITEYKTENIIEIVNITEKSCKWIRNTNNKTYVKINDQLHEISFIPNRHLLEGWNKSEWDFLKDEKLIGKLEKENIMEEKNNSNPPNNETPNNETPNTNVNVECKLCFNNRTCKAFIPCGHVGVCDLCLRNINVCPFCNVQITNTLKIYVS